MKLAVLTLLAVTTLLASGCGDNTPGSSGRIPVDRAPAGDDEAAPEDPPADAPEAPEAPET